jgi:peptidoglycan/xylan/chitin deacetylase (PgdA/CDA1 family)
VRVGDPGRIAVVTVLVLLSGLVVALPAAAEKTNPTVRYCQRNEAGSRFGDEGECVKSIQTFLKFAVGGRDRSAICPTYSSRPGLGRPLAITRTFNSQTRLYMKCFQEWHGLRTNGVANRSTYKEMRGVCREDHHYTGIPSGDRVVRSFRDYWFCNPRAGSVYLTFDDGPVKWTQAVMDVLDDKGVKATFFVLGWRTDANPDIAREVLDRGHSVQNHSHGHPNLVTYSDAAVHWQLEQASLSIRKATGRWPTCMRPPYGSTDERVDGIAAGLGLTTVLWTRNSADYSHQSRAVIYSESKRWGEGDIVLGHDTLGYLWKEVLGAIIDDFRDRGLEFDSMCRNPRKRPY